MGVVGVVVGQELHGDVLLLSVPVRLERGQMLELEDVHCCIKLLRAMRAAVPSPLQEATKPE